MAKGFLHVDKHFLVSGEVDFHVVQISQDPVPRIQFDPILVARDGGDYLPEAVLLVWGQIHHNVDRFNHPPQ